MSVDIVAGLGTCSAAEAAATKHINIVIYRTQITGSVYKSVYIIKLKTLVDDYFLFECFIYEGCIFTGWITFCANTTFKL